MSMTQMPRDIAARLGHETLAILEAGAYRTPSGRRVDLQVAMATAIEGTVEYPPEHRIETTVTGAGQPRIFVENLSVLTVARRMAESGPVAALNFASATSPGGGFLNGARAQEESIARCSALFACLEGRAMYPRHRAVLDAMYTDYVIYSPDVPVFRDDEDELLEEPWLMSILTSPAVHGKGIRQYEPERSGEIPAVMRERTRKVLAVAATHGHRRLILGAWGCGAFGCDPELVAPRFAAALAGPYRGAFAEVVFAILDTSPERRFIGPFERHLRT